METKRLRGKWIGHFSTVFSFFEQIIQRMLFWVIKPDTGLPAPAETLCPHTWEIPVPFPLVPWEFMFFN